jgi:hypothetical protein
MTVTGSKSAVSTGPAGQTSAQASPSWGAAASGDNKVAPAQYTSGKNGVAPAQYTGAATMPKAELGFMALVGLAALF